MTDAIVIGAGIIGASAAWRLAQKGLGVTLLDAGQAGQEASWAGAGMLAPGGEIFRWSRWSKFSLHSNRIYPAFVEELQQETGCAIDFQPNGATEIAATESEWSELRVRAERQRGWGIPSEPIAFEGAVGALFFPEDAVVDPRHVTSALLRACRQRGVVVREGLPATAIHRESSGISVDTAEGRLTGAVGVLAAGAWSGGIPFDHRKLPGSFPVRGHLIGYRLNPGLCPTILRSGETYLLQRANGLLIAGSSVEEVGFDRHLNPAIVDDIRRRAETVIPALRDVEPAAWLGFRPRCHAHQPQIGRFEDSNLWLAYGHFRNGILLAPATAERIRDQITSSSGTGLY